MAREARVKRIIPPIPMKDRKRWLAVVVFAMAMAWVESAVVMYLRTLIGRVQPYQPDPLPYSVGLGQTELVREAATLLMLALVGWLAGRSSRSRWGYALVAFGVWDLFYYVFLKPISGWPTSLLDWDILFLIPLPWWGPVLAPALIAALMVIGGTLISQFDQPSKPVWPTRQALGLSLGGALLALYTFMADALQVASQGPEAVRAALPTQFNWPVFIAAFALLAVPVWDLARQVRGHTSRPGTITASGPQSGLY
jgi:hypothetical protein